VNDPYGGETKTETMVMAQQATGSCLRGDLEPFAHILGSGPEPWLGI
jgi:hypothetical protein